MTQERKMLVAVDSTPTARKALGYVVDICRHLPGCSLCLLHVYPAPPPNYYTGGGSLDSYRQEKAAAAERIFAEAGEVLREAGLAATAVSSLCRMADHATISQAILAVQAEGGYDTVVVGKRGISKAEEFLFGSISSDLVHHARNFTLWIVS